MHDTCTIHRIRILITNVPKFDNKSTVTQGLARVESTVGGVGFEVVCKVCVSVSCVRLPHCTPGGAGGGWVGFAGGGRGAACHFRVGRGERGRRRLQGGAPGLRPLSRQLIRSSRGCVGGLGW
jgi:hypothetical protein